MLLMTNDSKLLF